MSIPNGYTYFHYNPDKEGKDILISIDPGKDNTGFRAEYIDVSDPSLPTKTLVMDYRPMVVKKDNKTKYNATYDNIAEYLNNFDMYIPRTIAILVEKQLPQNTEATKLAEDIKVYFKFKYGDRCPDIIDVFGGIKKNILCIFPGVKGKKAKKWCAHCAYDRLIDEGEYDFAEQLMSYDKTDDVADVVLMCVCYRILILGKPLEESLTLHHQHPKY